jgi:DNA polymerase III epsilon subunit-like protein
MPTLASGKLVRVKWKADGHIVLDTETSGGAKGRCAIIQIAACAVGTSGKQLTDTFCELVNTAYPITLHAQRVRARHHERGAAQRAQ